ncbi:MAG TPA: MFS transporter [Pseudolysinimonas sp.]|jgi:MFS family permease
MSDHDPRPALRRTTSPAAITAVLAFAGMGASFLQTVVIPIQGDLPRLVHAPASDTAWVLTITLLVSSVCTPISGRLGDMLGKRRVALAVCGVLVFGSIVCASSQSVLPLIIGRALHGMGLAVIPLGISILRDVIPPNRLGTSIAIVSATLGVGMAVGLPIGAVITYAVDWHLLFWIAAVVSASAFVLIVTVVPPSTLRSAGRFDAVGAVGLAIGLVPILVAISRSVEWGWSSPVTTGLLVFGASALVLWAWHELRTTSPLVDLRVTARPTVLLTDAASLTMGISLFASQVALPQLLELPATTGVGSGLGLLAASLVLMPSGVAMMAMSPIAGRLERSIGPRALLVAGAAIIAAAYLASLLIPLTVAAVLFVNVAFGVGIGLGYAAMPTIIMRSVPWDETAAANGVNTVMRALGNSIAAAAVGSILAAGGGAGAATPSAADFHAALLFGFIASVVCLGVSIAVPRATTRPGERPALALDTE